MAEGQGTTLLMRILGQTPLDRCPHLAQDQGQVACFLSVDQILDSGTTEANPSYLQTLPAPFYLLGTATSR